VCVGIAEKVFQGRRSKVKVAARPKALLWWQRRLRRCGDETDMFTILLFSPVTEASRLHAAAAAADDDDDNDDDL